MFNYQDFVLSLKENEEKKEVIEKYETKFKGEVHLPLDQQRWFIDYVAKFEPFFKYLVPEEIENDFDWILLQKLLASSFSSIIDYEIKEQSDIEMIVHVESNGTYVTKKITELWDFQVLRLYEIYVEEMMNLQILIAQDENEEEAILAQREIKLQKWFHLLQEQKIAALGLMM